MNYTVKTEVKQQQIPEDPRRRALAAGLHFDKDATVQWDTIVHWDQLL